MADPFSNPEGRYVVQPAETSADTIQVTARTASNVVAAATSAASFLSGSVVTHRVAVVINGTTYYLGASTTAW